jgi:hypothetical protein
MATGDVQRNRIIKSEHQGVKILFAETFYVLFSFRFYSFLGYFVSFPFQRYIVSFHKLEIYIPFRFVSFQKIMRFLRFVPFRFVPKPWFFDNDRHDFFYDF